VHSIRAERLRSPEMETSFEPIHQPQYPNLNNTY